MGYYSYFHLFWGRKLRISSSFPRMTIFLCLDNGPKICLTRRISSYEKNRMAASAGGGGSSSVFRDPNHIKFKVIMWSIKIPRPKNNMTTKKTLQIIFASAVPIQKIPEILLINSVRDSGFSA